MIIGDKMLDTICKKKFCISGLTTQFSTRSQSILHNLQQCIMHAVIHINIYVFLDGFQR